MKEKFITLTVIFSVLLFTIAGHTGSNNKRKNRVLTPLNKTQIITALKCGYKEVFNKNPDDNTIAMSLAQINLENAHGKVIYNNNLGNVGPRRGQNKVYYILGGTKFISHETPCGGSISYWDHLKVVCSDALVYFRLGNPIAAGHLLRQCNYYTASKQKYTKVLSALFPKALKRVKKNER